MNDNIFEGSTILEQLAELDLIDDFYEAVDSDNFKEAIYLMRKAGINEEDIEVVIRKMANSED